ncbi:MAG: hypothetical protein K6E54_00175 [Bacteroidaceae bacterium]|nr:hypothetical protein [Bacteroidaceae bacterium]
MKKLSNKWILVLSVLVSLCFVSCGSDDDNDDTKQIEVNNSKITNINATSIESGKQYTTSSTLTYNSIGQLTDVKIIENTDTYNTEKISIDYSKLENDNIISVNYVSIIGTNIDNESVEYKLKEGKIVSSTLENITYSYEYDENDYLINISDDTNGKKINITWENGCITNIKDSNNNYNYLTNIEYSRIKVGKYGGWINPIPFFSLNEFDQYMWIGGFFGKNITYYPSCFEGYKIGNYTEYNNQKITFTFDRDQQLPSSINMETNDDSYGAAMLTWKE